MNESVGTRIAGLEQENKELRTRNAELEKDLEISHKSTEAFGNQCSRVTKENEELKKRVAELERENRKLKDTNYLLRTRDYELLEDHWRNAEDANIKLTKKIAKYRDEIAHLKQNPCRCEELKVRVEELEKDERVNDSQYYRRLHEQSKERAADLEVKVKVRDEMLSDMEKGKKYDFKLICEGQEQQMNVREENKELQNRLSTVEKELKKYQSDPASYVEAVKCLCGSVDDFIKYHHNPLMKKSNEELALVESKLRIAQDMLQREVKNADEWKIVAEEKWLKLGRLEAEIEGNGGYKDMLKGFRFKIESLESKLSTLLKASEGMEKALEELCSKAFVDAERTKFIIPPAFEKSVRLAKQALTEIGG